MLFVVLCPGTPEGSIGSGSGFKASQKTGQWLKVSSDKLGEAGNRTCDPWFTRHRFIPLHHGGRTRNYFCGRVPWLYQYWPGWFMLYVVQCPGTPEGSTSSGSGFKASQKTGNGLKSHPTDWEKPGIEPATPGLQDIGLSPTPREN